MALFQPTSELEMPSRGDTRQLLSPRQAEIMDLVAAGLTNKDIANRLGLTSGTVKQHLAAIFRKLGVSNRTWAVAMWRATGTDAAADRPAAPLPENLADARLVVAEGHGNAATTLPPRLTAAVALALENSSDVTRAAGRIVEICRNWCATYEGELHLLPTGVVLAMFGYPLSHVDDPERAIAFADAVQHELGRKLGLALRMGIDLGPDSVITTEHAILRSAVLSGSIDTLHNCRPGAIAYSKRSQTLLDQQRANLGSLATLMGRAPFAQPALASPDRPHARWFSVEAWPPLAGKQVLDAWALAAKSSGNRIVTLHMPGGSAAMAASSLVRQISAQARDLVNPAYSGAGLGWWLRQLAEDGPATVIVHGWNEGVALPNLLSDAEHAELDHMPLVFVMGPVPVRGVARLAVRPLLARGAVPLVSRVHELPLPEISEAFGGGDIVSLLDGLDQTSRRTLELLLRYGRCTPRFLAQQLDITVAKMEQRIDRLHRCGLIAMWPDRSIRIRDERTARLVGEQLSALPKVIYP